MTLKNAKAVKKNLTFSIVLLFSVFFSLIFGQAKMFH